jgi:hypothetical protein
LNANHPPRTSHARLQGSWLALARAAWILLVALSLAVSIADIPLEARRLRTVCAGSSCSGQQLTAGIAQQLQRLNLPDGLFATYFVVLEFGFLFVWIAVALVIFWRRSDDRMALVVSLFLVLFSAVQSGAAGTPAAVGAAYPLSQGLMALLNNLGWISFVLFFFLFPDGSFAPRWTRWLVFVFLALNVLESLLPQAPASVAPQYVLQLGGLLLVVLVLIGLFSQIYRYRRVSSALQRQQTKWVLYGVLASIFLFAILVSLGKLFMRTPELFAVLLINTMIYASGLLIPLSIGFSVLRYRLYDIDIIVNRTLVYGTLTALLLLVYFGLVFSLQNVFSVIIHAHNDVAIVISTLGIAALFQPLRWRIQRVIDRRFYRRKYDAQHTLAAFSATLRSEVDLNALSGHLLDVVRETMQPAHASLWLLRSGADDARREEM